MTKFQKKILFRLISTSMILHYVKAGDDDDNDDENDGDENDGDENQTQ